MCCTTIFKIIFYFFVEDSFLLLYAIRRYTLGKQATICLSNRLYLFVPGKCKSDTGSSLV